MIPEYMNPGYDIEKTKEALESILDIKIVRFKSFGVSVTTGMLENVGHSTPWGWQAEEPRQDFEINISIKGMEWKIKKVLEVRK